MVKIKLAKQIHETAKEKGFWDKERNKDELFMLIITELAEAVEAHRKDRWANLKEFIVTLESTSDKEQIKNSFEVNVRGTVEEELADAWIRCMDYLYFRYNDSIVFASFRKQWADNFAENIFTITKAVADRDVKYTAYMIEALCEDLGIDLMFYVTHKMDYNAQREKLHGKAY